MSAFIIPLTDAAAIQADEVGPKAANLALLSRAGLPTPGGFALTATAYRHQLRDLGIENDARAYGVADSARQRRLSVQVRLAL
jgi:rifampicin phosphotransferase